jgi:hypothetical protein
MSHHFHMLAPDLCGRLSGLFMAIAFLCGATASGLAVAVHAFRGWRPLSGPGVPFAVAALALYVSEFRRKNGRQP